MKDTQGGRVQGKHWFVFADESGNFDFSDSSGASKYFAVGTITLTSDALRRKIREHLDNLSDRLLLTGHPAPGAFHASEDRQVVRDAVYRILSELPLRATVTALEKRKVPPSRRASHVDFYAYAWQMHFQSVLREVTPGDQVFCILASMHTKRKRQQFGDAAAAIIGQHLPRGVKARFLYWRDDSDRCLQAADYTLWAMTRLLEMGDGRARDQLGREAPELRLPLAGGGTRYY